MLFADEIIFAKWDIPFFRIYKSSVEYVLAFRWFRGHFYGAVFRRLKGEIGLTVYYEINLEFRFSAGEE